MNERIADLAVQATHEMEFVKGADVLETSNGEITYQIPAEFIETFAKLIVRECMGVVSKKCASPTAYYALRDHFGVEE